MGVRRNGRGQKKTNPNKDRQTVSRLLPAMAGQDQVIAEQAAAIASLQARIEALEAFRNRATGFAPLFHEHGASQITGGVLSAERIPLHGNAYHAAEYATTSYVSNNFAPNGHGNAFHAIPYSPSPHNDDHHVGSGI